MSASDDDGTEMVHPAEPPTDPFLDEVGLGGDPVAENVVTALRALAPSTAAEPTGELAALIRGTVRPITGGGGKARRHLPTAGVTVISLMALSATTAAALNGIVPYTHGDGSTEAMEPPALSRALPPVGAGAPGGATMMLRHPGANPARGPVRLPWLGADTSGAAAWSAQVPLEMGAALPAATGTSASGDEPATVDPTEGVDDPTHLAPTAPTATSPLAQSTSEPKAQAPRTPKGQAPAGPSAPVPATPKTHPPAGGGGGAVSSPPAPVGQPVTPGRPTTAGHPPPTSPAVTPGKPDAETEQAPAPRGAPATGGQPGPAGQSATAGRPSTSAPGAAAAPTS